MVYFYDNVLVQYISNFLLDRDIFVYFYSSVDKI